MELNEHESFDNFDVEEDRYFYDEDESELFYYDESATAADSCMASLFFSVFSQLWPLLAFCLLQRLICLLSGSVLNSRHTVIPAVTTVAFSVLFLLRQFEVKIATVLIGFAVIGASFLTANRRGFFNFAVSISSAKLATLLSVGAILINQLVLLDSREFAVISGAEMIMIMKLISLGIDFDAGAEEIGAKGLNFGTIRTLLNSVAYFLDVSTVLFGPWISYGHFLKNLGSKSVAETFFGLFEGLWRVLLSFVALALSSCYLDAYFGAKFNVTGQNELVENWLWAYKDGLVFRLGHYFVCFLSEATLAIGGGREKFIPLDFTVTSPLNIELPRSLVEMVTFWNRPMSAWLRLCVYNQTRPKYGKFLAILAVFASSSLLHGIACQMTFVLLSVGVYVFLEHDLRDQLAALFSACIRSKSCKKGYCSHRFGSDVVWVAMANLALGFLALFHLTYVACLFSDDRARRTGYSLDHAFAYWRQLAFLSPIAALLSFALVIYTKFYTAFKMALDMTLVA